MPDAFPVTIRQAWWKFIPLPIALLIAPACLLVWSVGDEAAFFGWTMVLIGLAPIIVACVIPVFRPFSLVVDENGFRTHGHPGQFSVAWYEVQMFKVERSKLGVSQVTFLRRYGNGDVYLMRLAPYLDRSPADVVALLHTTRERWKQELARAESDIPHSTLH